MNNNKIAIIDSSVGIISTYEFVGKNISEYFEFYIDNQGSVFGNYRDIEPFIKRWDKILNSDYKLVMVSDFDLAFELYNKDFEVVTGIESLIEDTKEGKSLYIASRNFKERKDFKGMNVKPKDIVDGSLLINACEDGIFEGEVLDQILSDVLNIDCSNYDKVYLLSSNLHLIKPVIEAQLNASGFEGSVKSFVEFLEAEGEEFEKTDKVTPGPKNFYTTGSRQAFYIPAEKFLKPGKPLTVRSYNFSTGRENVIKFLDQVINALDKKAKEIEEESKLREEGKDDMEDSDDK